METLNVATKPAAPHNSRMTAPGLCKLLQSRRQHKIILDGMPTRVRIWQERTGKSIDTLYRRKREFEGQGRF
jgi:hypothetical protein